MAENIKEWYDFTLLQMAAESYLHDLSFANEGDVKDRLIKGNGFPGKEDGNSSTRMSGKQAEYFLSQFEIVAHHKNDASGFSGTLFRNKLTAEYTLSMRSTEYRDQNDGGDWQRNGLPGADGQVSAYGYALSQIGHPAARLRAPREKSSAFAQ